MQHAIRALSLGKSFGGRLACSAVSFEVSRGEVFGLLGPNGAGKTTTLRMLAGLIAPDAGEAEVAGERIAKGLPGGPRLRARVGLLTENPGFYDRLTARENLVYAGALHGLRDADVGARAGVLLERLGLSTHAERPFAQLSRGMKQKLAIARAILHRPQVILLDEPTVGLDPEATREVRALVAELSAEGAAIVLCTHHLDEVERMCRRAAFVAGRVLGVHDLSEARGLRIALEAPHPGAEQILGPLCASVRVEGCELRVEPAAPVAELVAALVHAGARVAFVGPARDSLEHAWLALLARARAAEPSDG